MQFSFEFSASAEDVYENLTDPQTIVDRCIALGSIDAECDSDGEDLPEITIKRVEEAELPPMMKKIVGDKQQLKTVQQWSETEESYDSKSQTSVVGTPIKIDAKQSLYNTEDGSEIEIDLLVSAKIPLVGKKVEGMVASKVRKELLREFAYVNDHLA